MTKATRIRFVAAAALLLVMVACVALFAACGPALFPGYRWASRTLMGALAILTGWVPFSLCDFLLVALVLAAAAGLVVALVRGRSLLAWLSHVMVTAAALATLVVCGWALNHYAPPLSEEMGLELEEYSAQQLYDATEYYWQRAADAALQVERNPEDMTLVRQPFQQQAEKAGAAYAPLASRYDVFAGGCTVRVKELSLLGDALLHIGSDGIFVPLTGEANVPANCAVATQEFNMCHEAAHRLGLAAEEEANFAAFVACTASDDPNFQYSGYYRAFIACYSALVANYPEAVNTLFASENATQGKVLVVCDMLDMDAHYAAYEGSANDAGQAVNDAYLKAFGENAGVQSYGLWVDYLIAWHVS